MKFKEKQHQESKKNGNKMVLLKPETVCLSEVPEVLHETPNRFSSQFIVQ